MGVGSGRRTGSVWSCFGQVLQGWAPQRGFTKLVDKLGVCRSARQPSSAEGTVNSTTLSDADTWHTSRALRNVYFPPVPTQPPPQRLEQQQQQQQQGQQQSEQQGEQQQQEEEQQQGSDSQRDSQTDSQEQERCDGS